LGNERIRKGRKKRANEPKIRPSRRGPKASSKTISTLKQEGGARRGSRIDRFLHTKRNEKTRAPRREDLAENG